MSQFLGKVIIRVPFPDVTLVDPFSMRGSRFARLVELWFESEEGKKVLGECEREARAHNKSHIIGQPYRRPERLEQESM